MCLLLQATFVLGAFANFAKQGPPQIIDGSYPTGVPVHVFVPGEAYLAPPNRLLTEQGGTGNLFGEVTMDAVVMQFADKCFAHVRAYDTGTVQTIRVKAGQTLNIKFVNKLAEDPDSEALPHNTFKDYAITNMHTHGLHISGEGNQDNVFTKINGGKEHQYYLPIDPNHAPGTHWYHAHHHGSSSLHVAGGAVGMLIVEDDPAQTPQWIQDMEEFQMTVRDFSMWSYLRTFQGPFSEFVATSNEVGCGCSPNIVPPFVPGMCWAEFTGVPGASNIHYYLVNNQLQPTMTVETGKWYRFRTVVAGPSLSLAIDIPTGGDYDCKVYILSIDGVYVEKPILMSNATASSVHPILIAPGGRRDLAMRCDITNPAKNEILVEWNSQSLHPRVDCSRCNNCSELAFGPCSCNNGYGTYTTTLAGPRLVDYEPCFLSPEPFDAPSRIERQVLNTIKIVRNNANDATGPDTGAWFAQDYLRPGYLKDLVNEKVDGAKASVNFDVQWRLNFSFPGISRQFKVNGREFPMDAQNQPPELVFPLNKVSEITISGQGGAHPYHHHIVPFQVIDDPTSNLYGFPLKGQWMDTLMTNIYFPFTVKQRPDIPGHQIFHCHFLDHEDYGMMGLAEIADEEAQICCSPGNCDVGSIRACVAQFDPFCSANWDEQCVEEAQELCSLKCCYT